MVVMGGLEPLLRVRATRGLWVRSTPHSLPRMFGNVMREEYGGYGWT